MFVYNIVLGILFGLFGCRLSYSGGDIQNLSPSIYYKPIFNAKEGCNSGPTVPLLSPEGKVYELLCEEQFKSCVMQGACALVKEARLRSFNYYARGTDGVPRFKEVDLQRCPFGFGQRNICLDPFYTVAADLSIYSLGDVIFVPKIVGELMPDGHYHPGYFVIRDSGAAIKGQGRFDFYVGYTRPFSRENPFFRLGFADKGNSFEFRLATDEEAKLFREKTRFPNVRNEIFIPPR